MKINIRKIAIYVLSLSLFPLFQACLDEDPKGRMQEEDAYTSAASLERNCVASLYNYIGGSAQCDGLQGTARGVYDWNSLTTDEQMIPTRGGDWYDGGFWQRLYNHSWTASDEALNSTWNYLYKVIMLCNRSLYQIDQQRGLLSDEQFASLTAEVRALRAVFYWYVMDMWGRVPVVTEYNAPLAGVKQSERSEVFRFIVDELQDVETDLPLQHSNHMGNYYGRVTRPVAWFVLAKLALNSEVYTDDDWTDVQKTSGKDIEFSVDGKTVNAWEATLAYCQKIADAGYALSATCAENFSVQNEASVENIFTIPMEKTLYANQFWYLFRSRHYAHGSAVGMDAENGAVATLSTVRAFGYGTAEEDPRWALNFYADTVKVDGKVVTEDDGTPLIYYPLAVTATDLTKSEYEKTAGARMAKYELDRNAYADGKLQNNDIVLFRYADVVLMQAEATVRNGGDGTEYLNAVRSRAGAANRTCTLDNILNERLLELMWEGWRRQDLIRFNRFCSAYDLRKPVDGEESTHFTTVFPIPLTVLQLNTKLEQNYGY